MSASASTRCMLLMVSWLNAARGGCCAEFAAAESPSSSFSSRSETCVEMRCRQRSSTNFDQRRFSFVTKHCVYTVLLHGQVTIIFVVSVGLSACFFVCAEFFSAVFDPISTKLGHMLYVWVQLCLLEYRGCATPGGWETP